MNMLNAKNNASRNNVIQLFKAGVTHQSKHEMTLITDQIVEETKSEPGQQQGKSLLNKQHINQSLQRKQFWMSDTPVEVWD